MATLDELERSLREVWANLASTSAISDADLDKRINSHVRSTIKKWGTWIGSISVSSMVAIILALLAYSPLRHSVIDYVNRFIRIDTYLAEKLKQDKVVEGSLGEAIHDFLQPRLRDELFKDVIALSFPHQFSITIRPNKTGKFIMRYFASELDKVQLFCPLFIRGPHPPIELKFAINNTDYAPLSTFIAEDEDSSTIRKSISRTTSLSLYGKGIHELVMRVDPQPDFNDFTLEGVCYIVTIGRSDARDILSE